MLLMRDRLLGTVIAMLMVVTALYGRNAYLLFRLCAQRCFRARAWYLFRASPRDN